MRRRPQPHQPFDAASHECHFAEANAADLAIVDDLARPLAKLAPANCGFIDSVLAEKLNHNALLSRVRDYSKASNQEATMRAEVCSNAHFLQQRTSSRSVAKPCRFFQSSS